MYKYFYWHYTKGIKSFLIIWRNFIRFFWRYSPISFLARTLFYHWHRDISFRGPGFDIKEFFRILLFNIFSRLMGAIARSAVIIIGLAVEVATFIFGVLFFLIWLILPLALIWFVVAGCALLLSLKIFEGAVFLALAIVLFLLPMAFYLVGRKKFPSEMNLGEMAEQSWFGEVWLRAEIVNLAEQIVDSTDFTQVLKSHNLSESEFSHIVGWVARQKEEKMKKNMFWLEENLFSLKGIGKNWVYGYTLTLNEFSKELGIEQTKKELHLIGRNKEVETIERILARPQQGNVLLVGEPGVGKKTIIEGLAKMVYEGSVLPPLQHKRVLELDMGAVIAGADNRGETEARLQKVLNEAALGGNVILIINDFHNFIGIGNGVGKIDISGFLAPYLRSGYLKIIAISSLEGLHKNIEKNSEIFKYFEKVEIVAPDEQKSILVLEEAAAELEKRTGIIISYKAIKEAVVRANQVFSQIAMPERAIDLMEEAMIYTATKTQDKILSVKHIDLIFSEKAKMPVGEIMADEKQKLFELDAILRKRVVGQEEALKSLSSAMRRARLGISDSKKPIGSFMFLGPTGVGKTETAKALAEAYFGDENRIIRLDMSEYQDVKSISRLIGTQGGESGYLTSQIRENPFSVVLFDEIEKANPNILNLFLQALDEGWLTDAWGRKDSFRNAIIIATSNAGSEFIREMISRGLNPVWQKEGLFDYLQKKGIFRPEFLNRFDNVVVFCPLLKEHLIKVAEIMLKKLAERLKAQQLEFIITPELCVRVAELGYDPQYGARPMKRIIQERIENLISQRLLEGRLRKGDRVEVRAEEI
jgi:ATP-dependent Clp protease ATP-binding subunit ClpC